MFGKFTVNSTDWMVVQDYFKELSPQIIEHYLGGAAEKPWLSNSKQKYSQVYSAVYNLCIAKQSRNQRTYAFYQKVLEQFIIHCQIKTAQTQDAYNIIQTEISQWQGYCQLSKICKRVFQYLDRYYAKDNSLLSISDKSSSVYETTHLNIKRVTLLVGELVKNIRNKRDTKSLQGDSLLQISTMIKQICEVTGTETYKLLLLRSVQEITSNDYIYFYNEWIKLQPESFIINIMSALEFEKRIFSLTLPQRDCQIFKPYFKNEILKKYLPTLFSHDQGLKLFFKQQKYQLINKIFVLLRQFNCLDQLRNFYYNYMKQEGFVLFTTLKEADSEKLLDSFVKFYEQIMIRTNKIFESSPQFIIEFRKVMQLMIHLHDEQFNIAGKLVTVINRYFTLNTSEKNLQNVLIVFDSLTSKDMFIEAYDNDIAHRLITNKCPNLQKEIKFIQLIKQKCGDVYTNIIEEKINDYKEALLLNNLFLESNLSLSNKFTIKVLGKKYWTFENKPNPDFISYSIIWPQELISIRNSFEQFYKTKHQNKHIEHIPLLSSVIIDIKYYDQNKKEQKYEATINLLQVSILLYIEKSRISITAQQIIQAFQINEDIFNAQIKLFMTGISPLILHQNNSYKWNDNFNPNNSALNIEVPNLRKNSKAQTSNVDRELAIQGAIIKTLKLNGKLQFQNLKTEVETKLKFFKPSIDKIKQALEKLIEKQYVERDQENINIFSYKA